MPCIPDFHRHVTNPGFPYTVGLCKHGAIFNAAVDMFDAHSWPSERPVLRFLRSRQLLAVGILRRLEDIHPIQRNCLKAHILPQLAPCW
jgi:hypothetical protein